MPKRKPVSKILLFSILIILSFLLGFFFNDIKIFATNKVQYIFNITNQKGQRPQQLNSEYTSGIIIKDETGLRIIVDIKIKNTSLPEGIKTLYLVGCEAALGNNKSDLIYFNQGFVIELDKLIPYYSEQNITFDNIPFSLGDITCSYNENGERECSNEQEATLKSINLNSCTLLYSSDINEDRLNTLRFQFVNEDSAIKNYGDSIKTFNNVAFNPKTDVYELIIINKTLQTQ